MASSHRIIEEVQHIDFDTDKIGLTPRNAIGKIRISQRDAGNRRGTTGIGERIDPPRYRQRRYVVARRDFNEIGRCRGGNTLRIGGAVINRVIAIADHILELVVANFGTIVTILDLAGIQIRLSEHGTDTQRHAINQQLPSRRSLRHTVLALHRRVVAIAENQARARDGGWRSGTRDAVQGCIAARAADGDRRPLLDRPGFTRNQLRFRPENRSIVQRINTDRHRDLGPGAELIRRRRRIHPRTVERHQLEAVGIVFTAIMLINQLAAGKIGCSHHRSSRNNQISVEFQGAMRNVAGNLETERLGRRIAGIVIRGRVIDIGQCHMRGSQYQATALGHEVARRRGHWRVILRRYRQREGLQSANRLTVGNSVVEAIDEVLATGMGKADLAVIHILLGKGLVEKQRDTIQSHVTACRQ